MKSRPHDLARIRPHSHPPTPQPPTNGQDEARRFLRFYWQILGYVKDFSSATPFSTTNYFSLTLKTCYFASLKRPTKLSKMSSSSINGHSYLYSYNEQRKQLLVFRYFCNQIERLLCKTLPWWNPSSTEMTASCVKFEQQIIMRTIKDSQITPQAQNFRTLQSTRLSLGQLNERINLQSTQNQMKHINFPINNCPFLSVRV